MDRRSRFKGNGLQRTEVTNGERDGAVEDEDGEDGGGMGMAETSCIERVSRTETELPEGKARRSWELKSADPKLLRLGGPGSMQFQESGHDLGFDIAMLRQCRSIQMDEEEPQADWLRSQEWVSAKFSSVLHFTSRRNTYAV